LRSALTDALLRLFATIDVKNVQIKIKKNIKNVKKRDKNLKKNVYKRNKKRYRFLV